MLLAKVEDTASRSQEWAGFPWISPEFPPSPRDGFLEYAGRRFSVEDLIQMSAVSCDLCHRSIQEDLWGTHGPRDQEEIGGSADFFGGVEEVTSVRSERYDMILGLCRMPTVSRFLNEIHVWDGFLAHIAKSAKWDLE
jgi:hypothetical protein